MGWSQWDDENEPWHERYAWLLVLLIVPLAFAAPKTFLDRVFGANEAPDYSDIAKPLDPRRKRRMIRHEG